MNKKSNIAMAEYEQYFDKLQHGLIFDDDNANVIENSENENCNKKLLQNNAGPSQNKSYDRYNTHSPNECAKNTIKRLRAIPKRMTNDKRKKRLTLKNNPILKNLFTKHIIRKTKQNREKITIACAFAVKNTFGIQMKKILRI